MNAADLETIERSLDVILPDVYRRTLLSFPIPAYAGNADSDVWDNAKRIIEFNRELRAGAPGGVKPWPPTMFAMGHGGDGSPFALDLSRPGTVLWVDRCHLDGGGTYVLSESLEAWLQKHFSDLREDLEGDAVDADGPPEVRHQSLSGADMGYCGCLIALFVVLVIVVAIRLLGR